MGLDVLEGQPFHLSLPQYGCGNGVPQDLDFVLFHGPVLQQFDRPEFISTMDEVHLSSEPGQEDRLLHCCVPAADDGYLLVPIKWSIARRAIGHPLARQEFLSLYAQLLRGGAAGENQGPCLQVAFASHHNFRPRRQLQTGYLSALNEKAELLGLPLHSVHQFKPGNPVRKTRVVFHPIGGEDLTSRHEPFQQNRL